MRIRLPPSKYLESHPEAQSGAISKSRSSNPHTMARSVHQLLEFHLPLTTPGALRSRPRNRIDQPDSSRNAHQHCFNI
ncbi:hypothetical protein B0T18DRAFT_163663 [Schizothecium vesticola]|uniref:Uncharacterized protein n=1 Tax=Schizothecium vesticola TaxID=314040 RepID=A0AA40EWT5_9PEZI|nr:hypothetical protein B0T18DRAFT_163663 [Schizothecium vesticola]